MSVVDMYGLASRSRWSGGHIQRFLREQVIWGLLNVPRVTVVPACAPESRTPDF